MILAALECEEETHGEGQGLGPRAPMTDARTTAVKIDSEASLILSTVLFACFFVSVTIAITHPLWGPRSLQTIQNAQREALKARD